MEAISGYETAANNRGNGVELGECEKCGAPCNPSNNYCAVCEPKKSRFDSDNFKYLESELGIFIVLYNRYPSDEKLAYVKVPIAGWATNKAIQECLANYGDDYEFYGILVHKKDLEKELGVTVE